ncbi:MAG: GxxExxY protein [Chitinophagaceae bacterium]
MADFKYGELTQKIIGAAFRVHNILGNGFQEVIYQRALELELRVIPVDFVREFEMPIYYLDQQIGARRVDLLINNTISIELKSITKLEDVHLAQAINYLEAYNLEVGLLLNFGSKRLEFHRSTNKKFEQNVINHPLNPSHLKNPSSDNEKDFTKTI